MKAGAIASLAALALAAACGPRQTAPPAPPVARHLVFITIDTLRADRVGAYGSTDVETPTLDRLAREGASADASVQVPLTRPSHVTLFTGRYPAEHGIRDNVSPGLAADVPVLAEILQSRGFATAGFVSSIVLSRQSGLARGFDTYSDRFEIGEDDARFLNTIQRRGDLPTAEAISWLEQQKKGKRLFAWLHLYDPHDPYEPPEPFASHYAGRPYDGEVAWSDSLVGRLDAVLAQTKLQKDTLLVVTSDHGEGLGEHEESVHGFFVYETTLHVPLIVRAPGVKPGHRLQVVARTVDVLPTVLELLGLAEVIPRVSGRSLAAAFRGESLRDEPTYAESLVPLIHYGWSDLRTLRLGRWKYILAPRPELYDVQSDPGELRNLVGVEAARARALRAGLEARLRNEQAAAQGTPAPAVTLPPDLLEKLGSLGYVSGAGSAVGLAKGADPKDKIGEYRILNGLMREALIGLREGRFEESLARFRAMAARGIDSFELNYYTARALMGARRWREAAARYEAAIRLLPAYGPAYLGLSDARVAGKDLAGALEAVTRGQRAAPNDVRLIEREGELCRRAGRPDAAALAYERMVKLAPRDALARVRLGELHRDMGRPREAARLLREAVQIDPAPASYWNSLGMVLGGEGDLAGAERAFREATARDNANVEYTYNLGLAILRQQRAGEAALQFRRALEIDPTFGPARQRLAEARP
jgi:choline-sulfatase